MQKTIDFIKKHAVFFAVSFLLPVYHFIVVNRADFFQVSEKSFSFHAVDYSLGFCSRLFPGALYHSLVGVYTKQAVDIYLTCLYVLFILLLAFLLDRFSDKFKAYKKECFILIFLFLAGPFTFDMIVLQFGLLDFYFIFIFFLALLFLQNKFLRFAVPVLSAVMIAINYESLFSYVLLLMIFLFFHYIKTGDKKEKKIFLSLFLLTLFISVFSALYFLMNDTRNLTLSADAFEKFMLGRNANPDYYELFFYHRLPNVGVVADVPQIAKGASGIESTFAMLISALKSASIFQKDTKLIFLNIFALLPQSLLIYVLVCMSKKTDKIFKKIFVWLFVLYIFAFEVLGFLITSTNVRSLMHAVIMLFVFTMYLMYHHYPEGFEKLRALFKRMQWWLLSLMLFFYGFLIVNPSTLH